MFINGCRGNNDTYETATIFLTANSYRDMIRPTVFAIDLRNAPTALLLLLLFISST